MKLCSVDGCDLPHGSNGYCRAHMERVRRNGVPGSAEIASRVPGRPWTDPKQGYVYQTVNGHRDLQHRHVMSEMLGRKLMKHERVHHINGIRDDNRPDNLELWTTAHPAGQRVEDIVAFAKWVLSTYA